MAGSFGYKTQYYDLSMDHPDEGRMELDEEFLVDFGDASGSPARAHEIRWPGGDCTSDVWQ